MEQEKVNEITKRTEPITTRSDRQISNDDQYISDNLKEKVDQIMDSTQDPAASNDYLWPDWVKAYQVNQHTEQGTSGISKNEDAVMQNPTSNDFSSFKDPKPLILICRKGKFYTLNTNDRATANQLEKGKEYNESQIVQLRRSLGAAFDAETGATATENVTAQKATQSKAVGDLSNPEDTTKQSSLLKVQQLHQALVAKYDAEKKIASAVQNINPTEGVSLNAGLTQLTNRRKAYMERYTQMMTERKKAEDFMNRQIRGNSSKLEENTRQLNQLICELEKLRSTVNDPKRSNISMHDFSSPLQIPQQTQASTVSAAPSTLTGQISPIEMAKHYNLLKIKQLMQKLESVGNGDSSEKKPTNPDYANPPPAHQSHSVGLSREPVNPGVGTWNFMSGYYDLRAELVLESCRQKLQDLNETRGDGNTSPTQVLGKRFYNPCDPDTKSGPSQQQTDTKRPCLSDSIPQQRKTGASQGLEVSREQNLVVINQLKEALKVAENREKRFKTTEVPDENTSEVKEEVKEEVDTDEITDVQQLSSKIKGINSKYISQLEEIKSRLQNYSLTITQSIFELLDLFTNQMSEQNVVLNNVKEKKSIELQEKIDTKIKCLNCEHSKDKEFIIDAIQKLILSNSVTQKQDESTASNCENSQPETKCSRTQLVQPGKLQKVELDHNEEKQDTKTSSLSVNILNDTEQKSIEAANETADNNVGPESNDTEDDFSNLSTTTEQDKMDEDSFVILE